MIDLHSHILPGLDDGAPDMATALAMARIAVHDGIHHIVCTPHILPGMYDNGRIGIAARVAVLREALREAEIPLKISVGAEIHLSPTVPKGLRDGSIPSLGQGNAILLELPSFAVPRGVQIFVTSLIAQGYRPVLAHPERLRWIESRYEILFSLRRHGVAIQLNAGSLFGHFGRRAHYWAQRMLDDGLVDVIATDAHDLESRPPLLSAARDAAARRVGEASAFAMVDANVAELLASPSVEMPDPEVDPAHLTPGFILSLRDRIAEIGGLT